jgi:hypothetical protein
MNLYLYLPPLSSHPPSYFKGLIAGELWRYFLQNNTEEFKNYVVKFIGLLLDRGHKFEHSAPLFIEAAASLVDGKKSLTLYIH